MISCNTSESLWQERYRPKTIDDCILPPETKKMLQGFVDKGDIPTLMLCGHQGMGKAQPLTSNVLTPEGFKKMGDIQVGDKVIDGLGNVTIVTGVFPQGVRPVYRITLQDGVQFEVSDEHINSVIDIKPFEGKKFVHAHEIEGKEIDLITTKLIDNLRSGSKYAIKTVVCNFASHRLDPKRDYKKIVESTIRQGKPLDKNIMYGTLKDRQRLLGEMMTYMMVEHLTELGKYLLFKNTTVRDQVCELIRSTGNICEQVYHDGKPALMIHLTQPYREIIKIEQINDAECQCIMVDSTTHQYITDGYTVTHNTTVAKALINQLGYDVLFINASLENGIDVLRNKITSFVSSISLTGNKKCVILDEVDYSNCLEENELVQLADGTTIALKDMQEGVEYPVLSFNTEKQQFEHDTASVVEKCKKEVYRLELEDGSEVTLTDDHPIMVRMSDGTITTRTIKDGLEDCEVLKI